MDKQRAKLLKQPHEHSARDTREAARYELTRRPYGVAASTDWCAGWLFAETYPAESIVIYILRYCDEVEQ